MEQQVKPILSVTVLSALKEKYSEKNCMVDEFEHIQIQLSSKQKAVLKASGLFPEKDCQVIVLDGCGITSAGKSGEIAEMCPNILELDITNNQINDWNEVFKIVSQLTKLRFLNLCSNKLEDSTYSSALCFNNLEIDVFNSLSKLVLNNTNVSLNIVQQLLKFLPSLEELHLSLNGYSFVPKCEDGFERVKRLHFNGNAIKEWQEVENLAEMFPNLISLVIMGNPLENIHRENTESSLISLETLCLTNTMLKTWNDVDSLRDFKSLKDLKLFGIPLVDTLEEKKAREMFLARLPNINCLNGTPVTNLEREKAERTFIRCYQDNEEEAPQRYFELLTVHGKLDKLADVNFGLTPADSADVLMHITGRAPYLQKISLVQTLGSFKKVVSEMIETPAKKFSMYWKDMEINYGAEKLIYNKRKLYRYGIKDGDEIYVDVLE